MEKIYIVKRQQNIINLIIYSKLEIKIQKDLKIIN